MKILKIIDATALLLLIAGSTVTGVQSVIANDVPPPESEKVADTARILRVGLRNDTKPFSYPHQEQNGIEILAHYKGFMVEVCRRVLRRMKLEDDYENLTIIPVHVDAKNRFEDLESGKVDMLCGPDSLTTDRVETYNVSHPMFLSGMTYAYLKPTSRRFPRAEYCDNIIGFVNNTTAESTGIEQLSREGVLMRFDAAIDLNLASDARRFEILNSRVATKRAQLEYYHTAFTEVLARPAVSDYLNGELESEHPEVAKQLACDFNKANHERYVQVRADGFRSDRGLNNVVQKEIGKDIVTAECPNGFTEGLPIVKFNSHNKGIRNFCEGNLLYYLGDYDILHAKIAEHANCDVEFNRFTTNKEVYGAFFRSVDVAKEERHLPVECYPYPEIQSDFFTKEQSATLYADFNRTLLRMMQADIDILGKVYHSEFEGEPMSADLSTFLSGFRVAADLGPDGSN